MLADRVIVLDDGVVVLDLPDRAAGRPVAGRPGVRRAAHAAARGARRRGRPPDQRGRRAALRAEEGLVTAGPTAAPQRVPDEHRPPRGVVAAAGERPDAATPMSRTTCGSRRSPSAAKLDSVFFADSPALFGDVGSASGGLARADRAADRDGDGDDAHRADRDRVDDVQRAVQPGPAVRLARPHQRWSGGLEHRHDGRRRTRRATSASTSSRPTPSATRRAAEFVEVAVKLWDSWDDDAVVADKEAGVLGRRRPGPPDRSRRARTSGWPGRSTCRARRRVGRCWCRPGRRRTGKRLRRPVRRGHLHRAADAGGRARRSTPTSSGGPRRSAATRTSCSSCRASSRSSARPRPRPARSRRSSTG